MLAVLVLAANEMCVARAANRVTRIVPTRELDGITEVWRRYDTLSQRSFLRLGTIALERSLIRQTNALSDRVIDNYRAGLSTVRERQWMIAREALAHAVAAAPGQRELRAALRYCEGHIHRINGDAHKERDKLPEAQNEWAEAVAAFREAAELRPNWPDPFLGLARTFIYGLADVDRGADALEQAQRLGYEPRDRETTQLADGYRERGDTLSRNARRLADMPQEQEHLARAIDVYQRALALYMKIVHVGGVPRKIRDTQRGLDQAQRRVDELARPTYLDAEPHADSEAPDAVDELPL
jgi:tetratricopeptide (TPR) repeat protein